MVLRVQKGVAGAQSKRHGYEEENYMGQKNCFPQCVGLAHVLGLSLQFVKLLSQVPNRYAAIYNAQYSKAMENEQTKLFVALGHYYFSLFSIYYKLIQLIGVLGFFLFWSFLHFVCLLSPH